MNQVPSLRRQLLALVRKEFALEGQARVRINALLPFAMLVLLLFSFAVGPAPAMLSRLAPGFVWLALLLASVLSLGESQAVERAHEAQEGLRLLGVAPQMLFLGKALANTLFLFGLGLILTPVAIGLYGAPLRGSVLSLVAVLALGAAAMSAPGTLFATLAAQARGRDVLLPLLLFPILVPSLLGAVRATSLVMLGDPMDEMFGWVCVLVVFNVIYWLLCTLLYERVLEG
jgi:heme exporter protein B